MTKKDDYRILDRMIYNYRRYLFSGIVGDYLNHRRGSSTEFFDYREYVPGDDIRHINWKEFARNGKLFSKQFHEEAYFYIHLLVDNSRSMGFLPDKKEAAIRVANALAYVALAVRLPVEVELLCPSSARHNHVQANSLNQIEGFLETHFSDPKGASGAYPQVYADDTSQLLAAITSYSRRQHKKSGIAIFISDFLYEPQILNSVLRKLLKANFETRAIQVISHLETPEGMSYLGEGAPVKVVDAESEETLTVEFNRNDYEKAYHQHLDQISAVLKECRLPVLRYFTNESAVLFIRNHMLELGIIR